MKLTPLLSLFAFLSLLTATITPTSAEEYLFVAVQNPNRVQSYKMDAKTGNLELHQTLELSSTPGPMVFSPDHTKIYIATSEVKNGVRKNGVTTVGFIDNSHVMKKKFPHKMEILKATSAPNRVCYLDTDASGKFLYGSDYGAGQIQVMKIADGIATDKVIQVVDTERKTHSTIVDPSSHYLFVPHTGANAVFQFKIDSTTGKLTANTPLKAKGPAADQAFHEPRHLLFHPLLKTVVYTSNESGGGISRWAFDSSKGTLALQETLKTMPKGDDEKMYSADIRITPNGKFVYVSNRDIASKKLPTGRDSISVYSLDAKTGKMTFVDRTKTEKHPRTMDVDSTGSFLYVGGMWSGKMAAYKIDAETGKLSLLKTYDTAKSPIWIMSHKF